MQVLSNPLPPLLSSFKLPFLVTGDISALINSLRVSYSDQGLLASRDTCTWLPVSVYRMSVSLCLLYLSPTESIALISSRTGQSGALVPPILHSVNLHNTSIIVVSGQITRYPLGNYYLALHLLKLDNIRANLCLK